MGCKHVTGLGIACLKLVRHYRLMAARRLPRALLKQPNRTVADPPLVGYSCGRDTSRAPVAQLDRVLQSEGTSVPVQRIPKTSVFRDLFDELQLGTA